jgi:hypothetical protein
MYELQPIPSADLVDFEDYTNWHDIVTRIIYLADPTAVQDLDSDLDLDLDSDSDSGNFSDPEPHSDDEHPVE